MNETRLRRSSGRELGSEQPDDPRDDWLGDLSDDDWSEGASSLARATPATPRQAPVPEDEPVSPRAARRVEADPTDFTRRRVVAALVLLGLAALAGVVVALALRGGEPSSTTTASEPVTTPTTTQAATGEPTTTPTTTTPTATTPTTTATTPTTTQPETGGATGFTLPEGTKLQRDAENDAAVVRDLQQALTAAGYNPGPADGTYGEQTEAAVVAFQQANGLSADGRVGPETAAALNSALATG